MIAFLLFYWKATLLVAYPEHQELNFPAINVLFGSVCSTVEVFECATKWLLHITYYTELSLSRCMKRNASGVFRTRLRRRSCRRLCRCQPYHVVYWVWHYLIEIKRHVSSSRIWQQSECGVWFFYYFHFNFISQIIIHQTLGISSMPKIQILNILTPVEGNLTSWD